MGRVALADIPHIETEMASGRGACAIVIGALVPLRATRCHFSFLVASLRILAHA
jgi:hypothetical protein